MISTWACEEDEEDGIKKPKSVGDDEFVDDSGDEKSEKFGKEGVFDTTVGEPASVNVDEVIKPVMDDDVPLAVIRAEFDRVPPVRVKTPIRETRNLSPQVQPAVQKPKETQNQKKCRW